MGKEIMYGDILAKKLVIDPEEEKFTIVGETKAIPSFLKGIIKMVSQ